MNKAKYHMEEKVKAVLKALLWIIYKYYSLFFEGWALLLFLICFVFCF